MLQNYKPDKYKPDKYKLQTTSGFTMLEMMVVVIIVGFVAAIAAPSWQGFLDRQRMNSARSDLMGILKSAQDEAQARQQSKTVTVLPFAASTPLSVRVNTGATASTSGVTTQLGQGNVGNKFRLSVSSTASTSIAFDYDGRVNVTTPYVIKIRDSQAATPSTSQSCVIVTTILGGLKPANGAVCENF
jgi:prepilin-type N-terminal cleavage/methylation domain-containing protein